MEQYKTLDPPQISLLGMHTVVLYPEPCLDLL